MKSDRIPQWLLNWGVGTLFALPTFGLTIATFFVTTSVQRNIVVTSGATMVVGLCGSWAHTRAFDEIYKKRDEV